MSGSIKYRVLTRARGRCEFCGAHEHQCALEVDHIIPRNQGGPDDLSNVQALCFRCNTGKRDTDRTDFRGLLASYQIRQEDSRRVLLENELALCIADAYPVSEGHSLVIPRRHVSDGLELHQPEWNAVVELLKRRREQLAADDAGISGWAGSLNARGGAELRRSGRPDGVSCALASDPEARRGL
ncbi:HNH endonuclease [Cyanobium sp. Morenito 9A2]|nr:HNH endonuclease [Cyanobium sp. Morenito 9A2]